MGCICKKYRGIVLAHLFIRALLVFMCVAVLQSVTLLKPLNNPSLLLPYEQYYIQSLHQERKLIPEQSPGETNPLFQTVINPQPPHSAWAGQ